MKNDIIDRHSIFTQMRFRPKWKVTAQVVRSRAPSAELGFLGIAKMFSLILTALLDAEDAPALAVTSASTLMAVLIWGVTAFVC